MTPSATEQRLRGSFAVKVGWGLWVLGRG
uniref:Uncharacterized protein n=1 Tax=Anguilla anguilla TaxID=7936 RepID=A0A0E9RXA5_ANGAN